MALPVVRQVEVIFAYSHAGECQWEVSGRGCKAALGSTYDRRRDREGVHLDGAETLPRMLNSRTSISRTRPRTAPRQQVFARQAGGCAMQTYLSVAAGIATADGSSAPSLYHL